MKWTNQKGSPTLNHQKSRSGTSPLHHAQWREIYKGESQTQHNAQQTKLRGEKERGRHFLRSNPFSWHFLGIFSWRPSDLSSSFALRFFSFWSTPPTASTSPASVLRTFRRSVPSLFPCFRFVFFVGSVWIFC